MDDNIDKCYDCGTAVIAVNRNIDKCAGKRLYCELCLAQKDPKSATEQKIKKKYILITSVTAFLLLIMFIALNLEKTKNNTLWDYVVGYGLGYAIIWVFAAILLLPVLLLMKRPHREQIRKEKDIFLQEIEEKRKSRGPEKEQQE